MLEVSNVMPEPVETEQSTESNSMQIDGAVQDISPSVPYIVGIML